jgi:hypothetical protein
MLIVVPAAITIGVGAGVGVGVGVALASAAGVASCRLRGVASDGGADFFLGAGAGWAALLSGAGGGAVSFGGAGVAACCATSALCFSFALLLRQPCTSSDMVITAINVSFVRMAEKPPVGRPGPKHSTAPHLPASCPATLRVECGFQVGLLCRIAEATAEYCCEFCQRGFCNPDAEGGGNPTLSKKPWD